jgi:DNA-binding CsgD family transcriptional regulator
MRRLRRLANSGLPLFQYVQALFDIISEPVPNNDVKVMGVGLAPGEQWITRNLDHGKWGPLLKDLIMEAAPAISGVALARLREFASRQAVVPTEQILLPNYLRSPGYNELGIPLGLHHGIMVPLEDDGRVFATYCLWRDARMKPMTRADAQFLALSAPQIAHGMMAAKMLSLPDGSAPGLEAMTDWSTGVILMRPDGNVEGLNAAARDIFQKTGAFEGMPLDAFGPDNIRSALDYVAHVLRDAFSTRSDFTYPIPAASSYSHWTGIILRLRAFAVDGPGAGLRFVVLIERAETDELRRRQLMARFGLSAREFDSVRALAAGQRPVEIAHAMKVSQESVKSYLYRAREKLALSDGLPLDDSLRNTFSRLASELGPSRK